MPHFTASIGPPLEKENKGKKHYDSSSYSLYPKI
jgi:hypothetical protein